MKSLYISAAMVAFALSVLAVEAQDMKPKAAGDAAPMMTIDKATFVKVVGSANEFEIQSSELARKTSADDGIKSAADMIIADHKKAGEKLTSLLKAKGDPALPTKLSPKYQKMLDQLKAAKGRDFDILYLDMQAQAHMEAVGLFRTYAGAGEDQTLVGFARETLPRLETHLGHVKMLVAHHGM